MSVVLSVVALVVVVVVVVCGRRCRSVSNSAFHSVTLFIFLVAAWLCSGSSDVMHWLGGRDR